MRTERSNAAGSAEGTEDKSHQPTPIAIIGMGCRLPGGADCPATFWRLLAEGIDPIREIPEDRWSPSAHWAPTPPKTGKTYGKWGGFIDGIDQFDAEFFGISPREAAAMDPQQRVLLEVAWEAFEDAGLLSERLVGRPVGVFVGASSNEYLQIQWDPEGNQLVNAYTNAGGALSILANRISHLMDLRGPSLTIDTACSSSLVALHYACESLRGGDCEVALAGGVNILIAPIGYVGFSHSHMLSPDGRCRSFDRNANGFVRGEGAATVVLKPLSRAKEDGDPIHAVILATGINQDGRTNGISLPSEEAQVALLEQVYGQASVSPGAVSYVEAHGTGTPAGDPIEARALGRVLGAGRTGGRLRIGSVKSNIGHLEPASGIAGVMKCVLALRHRQIPATLHFTAPNADIDFDGLRLQVVSESEPWTVDGGARRIAGVNSFGFGGTNAHAVLAEHIQTDPAPFGDRPKPHPGDSATNGDSHWPAEGSSRLIPLTAATEAGLRETAGRWVDWLGPGDEIPLDGVAHTAATRRTHHPHRLAVVADRVDQLHERLGAWLRGETRREISSGRAVSGRAVSGERAGIAFVFGGMGSQWQGMGLELLRTEAEFARAAEEIDSLFTRLSGWSILNQLTADEFRSRIDEAEVAQPAVFTVQVALAALWKSWGIRPDLVAGHSVGEVAAAHVAGILSLEDSVRVVFHRSRLQHGLRGQGRMMAVGLPADLAASMVEGYNGRVAIAAVNSPTSITLSGEPDALEEMQFGMEANQTFCRFLQVDIPYHSPMMSTIQSDLRESLGGLQSRPSQVPFFSTVTGGRIDREPLDADYWWRNVRQPVLFESAMRAVRAAEVGCVVEIGAHPVLMHSIRECLEDAVAADSIIPSMRRGEPQRSTVLSGLGRLFTLGYEIQWDQVQPGPSPLVSLPTCAWNRETHWSETEAHRKARLGLGASGGSGLLGASAHPLLGQPLQTAHTERAWHASVDLDGRHAWLLDHQVQQTPVFPAAGYLELALATARQLHPNQSVCVESTEIARPMILASGRASVIETATNPLSGDFKVRSRDAEGGWGEHVSARIRADFRNWGRDSEDAESVRKRCVDARVPDEVYRSFATIGLDYGPAFRGIETARVGDREAWGRIRLPDELQSSAAQYVLHPAVLDACFQMLLCAAEKTSAAGGENERQLYLPVRVEELRVRNPDDLSRIIHDGLTVTVRVNEQPDSSLLGDLILFDQSGQAAVEIRGLEAAALPAGDRDATIASGVLWAERWEECPRNGRPFANGMPQPGCLAADVHPHVGRLREEHDRERFFREIRPARELVALDFAAEALHRLGFAPRKSESLSVDQLAEDLGVAESQTRLLGSLLSAVEKSGVLQRTAEGWKVMQELQPAGALDTWRRVIARWPVLQPDLVLLGRAGTCLTDILRGDANPIEVAFPGGSNDVTEPIYEDGPRSRVYNLLLTQIFKALVDRLPANRPLRVLEVGGGTGSASGFILPSLPADRTQYVFTDVSPQFFGPAEQKFRQFPFVDFAALDLEQNPLEQDFEPNSFDVILGVDVVHATASIRRSLEHLGSLLAPDGLLVLMEITNREVSLDLSFGILSGWWRFADHDLRTESPLLTWPQWQRVLTEQGFRDVTGISDAVNDEEPDHTILLARAPERDEPERVLPQASGIKWLIAEDPESAQSMTECFQARGVRPVVITVGSEFRQQSGDRFVVRPDQPDDYRALCRVAAAQGLIPSGIVHLGGLSAPVGEVPNSAALQHSQRTGADSVLALVQAVVEADWSPSPRLWLVTRGSVRTDRHDTSPLCLASAPLWGLARVIANETPQLRCSAIDLPAAPDDGEFDEVADEITASGDETEVVLRHNGRRFVPRLAAGEPQLVAGSREANSFHVAIGTPGLLETVTLEPADAQLADRGEVEIDVSAAAVNFKDVANALGLLSDSTLRGTLSGTALGLECSGRISAIGPGVTGFAVGDRVVAIAPDCFRQRVVAPAGFVRRIPDHMTFAEAAGLPIVFLTASWALNELARLREGERVLIHAAAGGVGLAAIQVARNIGAEIIATAGNTIKRNYLSHLGVSHVFDSRSLSFVDDVRHVTGGEGVDVVLNSLAGAAVPAGLSLLRPGGRFVEIGKRDIQNNVPLGLKHFDDNIAFFGLDLNRMLGQRLETAEKLLDALSGDLKEQRLSPIPVRTFPVSRVSKAFQHMANARHIGKIVLQMQDDDAVVRQKAPDRGRLQFDSDAIYLVTGGFNGFGLATAHWLIRRGARRLALLSRRGSESDETRSAVEELRTSGADVLPLKADVADEKQLADALVAVRQTGRPLRGVFHAAMVLDDDSLMQLTPERMRRVLGPKAWGAWNLHRLTADDPLHHFVLYSSATAFVGNPGQANYVAACRFLDQLAQHRRATNRPALSVAWGAVSDVGYVARNEEVLKRVEDRLSLQALPAEQMLDYLEQLMLTEVSHMAVFPADWSSFGQSVFPIAATPRLSAYADSAVENSSDTESSPGRMREAILECSQEDRGALLTSFLTEAVAGALGASSSRIECDRSLTLMGLDSLMAVDLQTRVSRQLGCEISSMRLMSGPTIDELTSELLEQFCDAR